MTATRRDELDELIEDITVDCYGDDEQLVGFLTAIEEELKGPVTATVVGVPVDLIEVAYDGDPRHGLLARCRRGEKTFSVCALDILRVDDPGAARLLTAYRRWSGCAGPGG